MAPGVRSDAVGIGLRRLRNKLEPDPSAPRFLINVHGVGWQLLLGESHETEMRTNLPSDLDGFSESASWRELSGRTERWLTLVGPPGIGKTRLARRYGRIGLDSGELDEVWEVDLAGRVDADAVRGAIAAALGVPEPAIGRTLAARGRVVVLLDGADALIREAVDEAFHILGDLPRTRVVATSIRALGIPTEVCLEVAALDSAAAVRLLQARIAEVGRSDLDEAHLTKVAEAVEGVPLALELCAARARIMPVDRLTAPAAKAVALEALRWSWRALEPGLRSALAQCAVFKSPFTLDAAEAVVRVPDSDVADLLVQLAECGLLAVDARGPCFTMRQRLREAVALEVDAETVERHRVYFLQWTLARHNERMGPLGWRAVEAISASEADLLAALRGSFGEERALMSMAFNDFMALSGVPEQRRTLMKRPCDGFEEPLRSRYLAAQAHSLGTVGEYAEAWSVLADADGDSLFVLRAKAYLHLAEVDDEAGRVVCERALELGTDDPMLKLALYLDLGLIETRTGNVGEAEAWYRRAFAFLRAIGNVTHTPRVRNQLAQHLCFFGEFAAALELLREPIDPEEIGRGSAGLSASLRGGALGALRQNEAGVEATREGIAISLRVGEVDRASFGLMTLADLLIELGRIDEAEQAGLEAYELATDALHRCGAQTIQASVARWSGAWRIAARALNSTLEMTQAGAITCHAQATLATVRAAQGQLDDAERHLALATEDLTTTADPVADTKVAIARAALAHARGDSGPVDELLTRDWDSVELRVERLLLARHLEFTKS